MSKYCSNCGAELGEGISFCGSCGAPVQQEEASQVNYGTYSAPAPRAQSMAEFLRLPENAKLFSGIKSSAIICYICAGFTAIAAILASNPFMFIDVLLVLGLGLGIQLKQSRVCAILLTALAAFNMISGIVQNGTASGWLIIIAAIYACINTFKLSKAWKEYSGQ